MTNDSDTYIVSAPDNSTSVVGYNWWQKNVIIGIAISICGNIVISVSLNVQKYTHMRIESAGNNKSYMRVPLWWLGLSLLALGEIGNFAAYGFAPASLVAPLGTVTVIANTFIAVLFLNETLRSSDILGSAIAVVGCFLTIFFANMKEPLLNGDQVVHTILLPGFLVYLTLEVVLLAALLIALFYFQKESVVVFLLIASILSSFTVICAKAASGMIRLTLMGNQQLTYPVFYVMVVIMIASAALSIIFLNKAMQLYNATVVVPTHFTFFTISAIVAGAVFFNEFQGLSVMKILMFLVGCVMAFIGVYIIQLGRPTTPDQPNPCNGSVDLQSPSNGNLDPAKEFIAAKEVSSYDTCKSKSGDESS